MSFISIPVLNNLCNIKQCYVSQTSTDYLNYKVKIKRVGWFNNTD